MEVAGLRIRIPTLNYLCSGATCFAYAQTELCEKCEYRVEKRQNDKLYAWVREEVTPTTFARQPEVIHGSPLRRYLSG